MYGLTNDLEDAQHALSPTYSVTATVGALAPGGGAQGEPWLPISAFPTGLAGWTAQGIAHDAVANDTPGNEGIMRLFLSHHDGKVACQWCPGIDDTSATFTAPSLTTIATFSGTVGIFSPKPALVQEGGRWHAYYLLPDGVIYHRVSTNNGATWSAASTVYSGDPVGGDLYALHLPADDLHLVQFSTSTDAVRMRGAARAGSGAWQVWTPHASASGWVPAGMAAIGGNQVRQFCIAWTPPPRRTHLGSVDCTVDPTGALTSRSTAVDFLHLVEGEAPVRPLRIAAGRCFGGVWYTAHYKGATRAYLVAGRIDQVEAAHSSLLGECLPVSVTPLPAVPYETQTIPMDRGDRSLLMGLATVYRSTHRTLNASTAGEGVISYRHKVARNRGGRVEVVLRRQSALAALLPGDLLWLTRACRKGELQGEVTLGFVVQRVELSAERMGIEAVDALGSLTESLTPFTIEAGKIDDTHALRALCAWGGVESDVEMAAAGDAPAFYWRAGERGSEALLRYLRRLPVCVRSRVAAVGAYPLLRIDDDAPVPLYGFGAGAHPLISDTTIADALSTQTVAVRGVAVRNQPEDGEDWALASHIAQRTPGQKGLILALEDRNLEPPEIADIAHALAERGAALPVRRIAAQANLALEVHDHVTVQGETLVVDTILESWEEGRLIQHVELCRIV